MVSSGSASVCKTLVSKIEVKQNNASAQGLQPMKWHLRQEVDIAKQTNGVDCGPLLLANAREVVLKDMGSFSESDMNNFRSLVCLEFIHGRLL